MLKNQEKGLIGAFSRFHYTSCSTSTQLLMAVACQPHVTPPPNQKNSARSYREFTGVQNLIKSSVKPVNDDRRRYPHDLITDYAIPENHGCSSRLSMLVVQPPRHLHFDSDFLARL